jgi:hypothetical protein
MLILLVGCPKTDPVHILARVVLLKILPYVMKMHLRRSWTSQISKPIQRDGEGTSLHDKNSSLHASF